MRSESLRTFIENTFLTLREKDMLVKMIEDNEQLVQAEAYVDAYTQLSVSAIEVAQILKEGCLIPTPPLNKSVVPPPRAPWEQGVPCELDKLARKDKPCKCGDPGVPTNSPDVPSNQPDGFVDECPDCCPACEGNNTTDANPFSDAVQPEAENETESDEFRIVAEQDIVGTPTVTPEEISE